VAGVSETCSLRAMIEVRGCAGKNAYGSLG